MRNLKENVFSSGNCDFFCVSDPKFAIFWPLPKNVCKKNKIEMKVIKLLLIFFKCINLALNLNKIKKSVLKYYLLTNITYEHVI